MEKLLGKAVRLAAKVHQGQLDRFDQPFLLHVLRVATKGRDAEEQVLGALHDVLERSELTMADLRERGYPEKLLVALDHITRRSNEDYETYIDRVALNSLALRVKVHDLADKMDLRNVAELNEADLRRYNKQMAAYKKLKRLSSITRAQMTLAVKQAKAEARTK